MTKVATLSTIAAVSLLSLNTRSACDQGYTFEFLDHNNNKTGITVTVVGKNSTMVDKWFNDHINKRRMQEAHATKAGKAKPRTIEDDLQFGNEYIAMRVIDWTGITESCTFENVVELCKINPEFVEQVDLHSSNLENFIQSK